METRTKNRAKRPSNLFENSYNLWKPRKRNVLVKSTTLFVNILLNKKKLSFLMIILCLMVRSCVHISVCILFLILLSAEHKLVLARQNSLRPIFVPLLNGVGRRERQHASPLRRLLAESAIDYVQLQVRFQSTQPKLMHEKRARRGQIYRNPNNLTLNIYTSETFADSTFFFMDNLIHPKV